ncbi:peroxiredoxin [Agitococcus lubricus]|uniref:thioredoxin-dependent peroxiredoxin n=1 Tax=Agitococcus lubricus TaxID=1077255 RepID=A0A2T5IWP9_9GAMM|nr:peroxiredoxin [Agitococcus lubricus]PTQ88259.1 peroxiredoxin Q/BCP [Agitococcus lubricus]
MSIQLGDSLPNLTIAATGQTTIQLNHLIGQFIVIYFYPKDATPGCTTEAQDFRDLMPDFVQLGCTIFGVSRDSLASHEKFKANECLPFALLSDSDEQLCQHFDVIKLKNMYGKQVLGIERSTFLFDRSAKLIKEWRKVKVSGHAQDVLNHVRQAT